MKAFADRLRGRISEDALDNVTSTLGLAAMLCLFVVNPTGFVPELLIGAMLSVALIAVWLDLALYGFGDDEDVDDVVPQRSRFRRAGAIAAILATVAALTAICALTAESTDPDTTMLWVSVGIGTLWAAIEFAADRTSSTDTDH